jgi:hypothetical protein
VHLWRIQGVKPSLRCPHAPQLTEKTLIHGRRPGGQMKNGRGGGVKPLPIPLVRWGITIYAWGGHYRGTSRRWGRVFHGFDEFCSNSAIGNDPHLCLLCLMAQIPGQIVSRLPSLPLVKGRRCQRSYQAPSPLIHHHAICVIT